MELSLARLEADDKRPDFACSDPDLSDFFHNKSAEDSRELISVTNVLYDGDTAIAFYCVSNDALRKEDAGSNSRIKRFLRRLPHKKRLKSNPAVKIGRLAVADGFRRQNIGSTLLDRIKYDFTHSNKTGCRFIIVDAYNNDKTLKFYQKNGFEFLLTNDTRKDTRLMYFDLIRFVDADDV